MLGNALLKHLGYFDHILVISVACLFVYMTHHKLQRDASYLNQRLSVVVRLLPQLGSSYRKPIAFWLHSWHFYHNHTTKALLQRQMCKI